MSLIGTKVQTQDVYYVLVQTLKRMDVTSKGKEGRDVAPAWRPETAMQTNQSSFCLCLDSALHFPPRQAGVTPLQQCHGFR